jgi:hypothetical protein
MRCSAAGSARASSLAACAPHGGPDGFGRHLLDEVDGFDAHSFAATQGGSRFSNAP